MKNALDLTLRDEQAGFRKECSYTDKIATLRGIVEQTIEWQTPLCVCFVDFEKVFDSIDRQNVECPSPLWCPHQDYKHHPKTLPEAFLQGHT